MKKKYAVVLLSGGIDSSTTLAIAKNMDYKIIALTIRYKQRHWREIDCARKIAKYFKVAKHIFLDIDLSIIGGSALTNKNINIPKHRTLKSIKSSIPLTYVPARNTIFLSIALAVAEVFNAKDIFIGVNAIDYSGYPDCRPEFIRAFEKVALLGTKKGVEKKFKFKIHTPLIDKSKAEIIKLGHSLGVDFSLTNSCYAPSRNGSPCGACDSCLLRKKGFAEAGLEDPLYV